MAEEGGFILVSSEILKSVKEVDLPEQHLNWCSVNLNEVYQRNLRLEASVFDIEGKQAREMIEKCKWPLLQIAGKKGMANAFYPTRFKRILVDKSEYPLILPSQIQEINPKPKGYMSPLCKTNFNNLKAKKGQILLTRSGTIGNCSLVSETLDGVTLSDDIIRISCKKEIGTGYLYAYLKTKTGNALVRTNQYGAVVKHIEPEHLETIFIPNPPDAEKKEIHIKISKSYALLDESNTLLDDAEKLLMDNLNLPPLNQLIPEYFDKKVEVRNFETKLSNLSGRIDPSYHIPIVDTIIQELKKKSKEIVNIKDPKISRYIILPGRFARVYVEEGQGTVFFGGKQLFQLDPTNKKYLSLVHHGERIKSELKLEENMIMITCSGTIGKVTLTPKHWNGWTANQHIIRIVPASSKIAGYLYVFLSSDYGHELITHFTYGSVVDEIDNYQVAEIPIPILKDKSIQDKINNLALGANQKRTEAYHLEQEAIRLTNEIIHTQKENGK